MFEQRLGIHKVTVMTQLCLQGAGAGSPAAPAPPVSLLTDADRPPPAGLPTFSSLVSPGSWLPRQGPALCSHTAGLSSDF